MLKKLKRSLLVITLLGWFLIGVSNGYGTQPEVISAAYFDSLNVLQILFDQPVFIDSAHAIREGITINGYYLDQYEDFSLTGGFLPGDPENPELSDTVKLTVTFSDQKEIEKLGYANKDSLRLVMPSGRFINEQYEGNGAVTKSDNIKVQFWQYFKPPAPVKAVYDAATNKLGIKFSKTVQAKDKVDYTKISLDDDFGGPNKDLLFSSAQEFIPQITATDSIIIEFTPKHQQVIESFNTANLSLRLNKYAFLDQFGNTNKVISAEDSVRITYLADTEPTLVDSANYNAKENKLRIYFNEGIVTTYKRFYYESGKKQEEKLEGINYTGITIFDSVDSAAATLSGYKSVTFRAAEKKLEIMVLPADQILIETLKNTSSLKLLIDKFAVLDENLNGIREFTLNDSISVTYIPEENKDAPIVTEGYYLAATNQLELHFGNIKPTTKGIDTTNVTLSWIQLQNTAGDTVNLTGGSVHGVKAGVPRFIREIYIDIIPEDELKIERLTNGDSLFLTLKPLTFFFESYNKTGNGNHILPVDSQMVIQYIPDTVAAEIVGVKYDFVENELKVSFNKRIQYSSFNPQSLEIGGIQLSGGSIKDTSFTKAGTVYSEKSQHSRDKYNFDVIIDVLPADQQTIEALDNSTKANLPTKVTENSFKNLDNVYNPELNILNGDSTSAGELIFIGYGRSFWDQSFEAFITEDQLVPASLRAVGEHCYIFVADDQWTGTWEDNDGNLQPIITQAYVDSFLIAFEQSTPANDAKGIYNICHDYFGQEVDTDGDSRITILFLDLRDEYDQGRAARAADVPRAGAFLARNELPDSVDAHSAETDMIFIDSEPIIRAGTTLQAMAQYFTHMIFHGVDPDEEQWLVEGMGGLAPVICGYQYTSHRFPAEQPKAAANKTLNFWTGWNGGTPDIDINEFYHTSLFCLYLYEQFGGEVISAIAADTAKGLQSIRNALPQTVTLEQVFDDYAVAGFLDRLNHPAYGNKYGFQAVDLGFPALASATWATDNLSGNQPQWSFSYYKTKKNQAIDQIRFNGNNATNMSLIFTTIADTFLYKKATLDSLNETLIDVSDLKVADVLTVVTSKSSDGPTISDYVISKDITPPENVNLTVFQNPSADRNLSIYVVSNEQLYKDVPTEGSEGPKVTIALHNKTTELEAKPYFTNEEETMSSYVAVYSLTEGGNYTITASGQDQAGNDFETQATSLAVRKINAQKGGTLNDNNNMAWLTVLPGSIIKDRFFTLSIIKVDKQNEFLSDSYRFGPADVTLNPRAKLTLRYNGDKDIAIYRLKDSQWEYVGGKVNQNNHTITVNIERLGEFRVMTGEYKQESQIPKVYSLSFNYPNPFNPSTLIRYGLPKSSYIILEVYNLLGQKIAELFKGRKEAGIHQVEWDATGFSSGIYFYRLSARSIEDGESFTKVRKMTILK